MDVDLAKELYFRELGSKDEVDKRLGVYVALLSAIGSVLAFLVRSGWTGRTPLRSAELALEGIAVLSYFLAIAWIMRATVGHTYEKLPSPANLLGYWRDIEAYHQANPGVAGDARTDFDDFLLRHLASAATRNAENNLVRSALFYRAAQWLLLAVVVGAAAGLSEVLAQLGAC
jgi:hypothetical protein